MEGKSVASTLSNMEQEQEDNDDIDYPCAVIDEFEHG